MFDVSWGHASCGAAAFPNVAPGPVWGFKKHLSYEVSSFLRGTQWSWDPLRAACHFAAVPIAGPGQRGQSSALGGRFAGGEGSGRPRGGPPSLSWCPWVSWALPGPWAAVGDQNPDSGMSVSSEGGVVGSGGVEVWGGHHFPPC